MRLQSTGLRATAWTRMRTDGGDESPRSGQCRLGDVGGERQDVFGDSIGGVRNGLYVERGGVEEGDAG